MAQAPAHIPSTKDLSARERELVRVTIEVLDEHGYDRRTVDEVAARARASKATIYRRWPSKAVLITAALAARMDASALAEQMDDAPLRDELLHLVGLLAAERRAVHATIGALLGEAIRNDELRAKVEEHFVTPRRDHIRSMLERRRRAGDIRDDIDVDLVGPIPTAIIYQRLLITHEPVDDTLPERVVDELMLPLLTKPRGWSRALWLCVVTSAHHDSRGPYAPESQLRRGGAHGLNPAAQRERTRT